MFRFSAIAAISLIACITAKPFKPQNKFTDESFQNVVMSLDKDGKMSWGMEVEPPEDLDRTDYDIDPNMKIWKSMTGGGKVKAEEDEDAVYHKVREELAPYLAPLMSKNPADAEVRPLYSEPEEDMDDVYHKDLLQPVPHQADAVPAALADAPSQRKHSKPEEDLDHIYHQ